MLNEESMQETARPFSLLLEFLPDRPEENDPAFIHAIGRDTVEALQHDGVTSKPVYTGKQGGGFLVEIVTAISQLATTALDHKVVIEELLNDASASVTLAGSVVAVINHVKHVYERHIGHNESVAHPLKITLEANGNSITTEGLSLAQAQDTLKQLAQQSQDTRTRKQDTLNSNTLIIQPRIPKKKKKVHRRK